MKFSDLHDGLAIQYRIGKPGERSGRLSWNAWRPGILRITICNEDWPKGFRNQTKYWHKGDLGVIWVEGVAHEKRPDDVRELDDGTILLDKIDGDPCLNIKPR